MGLTKDRKTLLCYRHGNLWYVNLEQSSISQTSNLAVFLAYTIKNGLLFTAQFGDSMEIKVWNISDPNSFTLISENSVGDFPSYIVGSADFVLSPDMKTLFEIGPNYLRVFDIDDSFKITFLMSLTNTYYNPSGVFPPSMEISKDCKTAFIFYKPYIQVLDISNRTNIAIVGLIPQNTDAAPSITFLSDVNTFPILIADGTSIMKQVDVKPLYTVYLEKSDFERGAKVEQQVNLLTRNRAVKYALPLNPHKFVKTSLYVSEISRNSLIESYPALPAWMMFDRDTELLTVAPTSEQEAGIYDIYFAVSLQINCSMFSDLGSDFDPDELMITLLMCGYIDNTNFTTLNFNAAQSLMLPASYNAVKTTIRDILQDNYIHTKTRITVSSSLKVQDDPTNLTITTRSQFPPSIAISLMPSPSSAALNCQFVTTLNSVLTPTFSQNDTVINIDGPLYESNNVLQNIIFNSRDNTICDALMNVTDYLNYPSLANHQLYNVSQYFQVNKPPQWNWNHSLQDEIDKTPLHTGTYFIILLQGSMFNQDGVTVDLTLDNDTEWVTQSGFSLSGTPPTPIYPRFWPLKYQITINVRNQYKSTPMEVSIEVHLSWSYFLKEFLQLVAIIGFWVHFNTFLNISYKKAYQCPKDLPILVEKPMQSNIILPVAFIGSELKEARIILKHVRRYLAREVKPNSKPIESYFYDQRAKTIDTERLFFIVEKVVSELPSKMRDKVRQYAIELKSKKDLIRQLIVNELYTKCLSIPQEQLTKEVFDRCKHKWIDLVHKAESYSWQFAINRTKLMNELDALQIPHLSRENTSVSLTRQQSQEIELGSYPIVTNKPGDTILKISIGLLEGALLAYAFTRHHVKAKTFTIDVVGKEKTDGYRILPRMLNEFFKLDLKTLQYDKGNSIGYGIAYKLMDDVLEFYGTPTTTLVYKSVAVQIMNRRGRILREIWLHGVKEKGSEQSANASVTL